MKSIILILLFLLTSCLPQGNIELAVPQRLDDNWTISTPEQEGFDQQRLEQIIGEIPVKNPKLDGIVIARHGKLVVDQYFNGYSPIELHKIWSITKMITSTLLGIAMDQELLSVKDSIHQHLSDYLTSPLSSKRNITIEHLITMTSGLEWVELGGPKSTGGQLPYASDWIDFILDQPLTQPPGEVFNYSTGNTMLLAPIIKSGTGREARDFAKTHLFDRLGIEHYEWDTQSEFWTKTQNGEIPGGKPPLTLDYKEPFADYTNTGTGLRMRPRDLCKFGQLHLAKGRWDNHQIVSKDWIEASTQPHFGNNEYGYHWRLMKMQDIACFYATGFGLQRIFVFPELELVIVMIQQHYRTMPKGRTLTNQLLEDILMTISLNS